MSDNDKNKSVSAGTEESVDDILAGILNPDGTFNDEFNGLFARYVGGTQTTVQVPVVDISDRSDEEGLTAKADYDAEPVSSRKTTADERIEEKMPEGIREVYTDASGDARRPEFTSTGDVRYPTMGVGESEERVVYDADWEETARKEAQRLERVRQDRMLRGDSAYARTFVAGGSYLPRKNPYIDAPSANSLYIDPLSGDEDFETADINSQYYNSNKKPFFPEGFSAAPKNNSAAGGKTERPKSGRYVNEPVSSDMDWLRVDDKNEKKKKRRFGKKKTSYTERPQEDKKTVPADTLEDEKVPERESTPEAVVRPFSDENIEDVITETQGLRSTVAQIVDKYNKRSEEEARKKLEEEARQEELRREEELRERRRQEEIRLLKKDMSPELCEAIDSEEENASFDEYDDFSTVTDKKEEKTEKKAYGVVFDAGSMNDTSDVFVERLDNEEAPEENDSGVNNTAVGGKNNKGKKRSGKKSGRKDN